MSPYRKLVRRLGHERLRLRRQQLVEACPADATYRERSGVGHVFALSPAD